MREIICGRNPQLDQLYYITILLNDLLLVEYESNSWLFHSLSNSFNNLRSLNDFFNTQQMKL